MGTVPPRLIAPYAERTEMGSQPLPEQPRARSSHSLLNMPPNPNLDITIRKGHDGLDIILISLLSRLFRRREKPRPKQDHVSLFEVLPDGPYAACERCHNFLDVIPDVDVEVFYEKERGHRHLFQSDPDFPWEMDARLYYDKYDSETRRRINRIADNNGIKVIIRWDRDSRLISRDQR